jgi:hypothetical protein
LKPGACNQALASCRSTEFSLYSPPPRDEIGAKRAGVDVRLERFRGFVGGGDGVARGPRVAATVGEGLRPCSHYFRLS